ncbi:MAG: alpha amylase family protein [Fimbriimonadaceae bacterium]
MAAAPAGRDAEIVAESAPVHRRPGVPAPRFERGGPLVGIPPVMLDSRLHGVSLANQIARSRNVQARILWVDATANIDRYNTDEKVRNLVANAKRAGFNTIVFDVKPISGQTVYPSRIAPRLTEWRGRILPPEFDPLAAMIRECRAAGMPLHVSLNAFSEGHRLMNVGPGYAWPERQTVLYDAVPIIRFGDAGTVDLRLPANTPLPAADAAPQPPVLSTVPLAEAGPAPEANPAAVFVYTDNARLPEPGDDLFAVTVDRNRRVVDGFERAGISRSVPSVPAGGMVLVGRGPGAELLRSLALPGRRIELDTRAEFVRIGLRPNQIPLMMNPHLPIVREYALSILRELLQNYAVDGVLYDDRLRYGGMNADFSPEARRQFEAWVGEGLQWPDDVFKFTLNGNFTRGIQPGRHYEAWMVWRARRMQEFIESVRAEIARTRPNVQLGVYQGSWYGEYPSYGSNWGSNELDAGFWFLSPEYRDTGFAHLLDYIVTGAYYPTATIHEAMSRNVDIGATVEAAGYLTTQAVRDATWGYAGVLVDQFRGNRAALANALQAAAASSQGVMVFDLSHGIEDMWDLFARAFAAPARAPHEDPKLVHELRRRRAALDRLGSRPPTVVITAGSTGAGL